MPARLVPLAPDQGPVVPIQRPVVLIGRHPECDVRIDLPDISRRHCCVALANDQLLIRDLGSRNGVWVNGRKIDEARLRIGDEVAIAGVIYRLEEEARSKPEPIAAPAPPPPAQELDLPALPGDEPDLIPIDDDLFNI